MHATARHTAAEAGSPVLPHTAHVWRGKNGGMALPMAWTQLGGHSMELLVYTGLQMAHS